MDFIICQGPRYGSSLRLFYHDNFYIDKNGQIVDLGSRVTKSEVLNNLHKGNTVYELVHIRDVEDAIIYELKNPKQINVNTINELIEAGAPIDKEVMLKYAISKGDIELVQYLHNVHGVDLTMCDSYAFNIVKSLMDTDKAYCDIAHYIIEHYPQVLSLEDEKDKENHIIDHSPVELRDDGYMDVTGINHEDMSQLEEDFDFYHPGVEEVKRLIELADRKIAFLKCQVSDDEENDGIVL